MKFDSSLPVTLINIYPRSFHILRQWKIFFCNIAISVILTKGFFFALNPKDKNNQWTNLSVRKQTAVNLYIIISPSVIPSHYMYLEKLKYRCLCSLKSRITACSSIPPFHCTLLSSALPEVPWPKEQSNNGVTEAQSMPYIPTLLKPHGELPVSE